VIEPQLGVDILQVVVKVDRDSQHLHGDAEGGEQGQSDGQHAVTRGRLQRCGQRQRSKGQDHDQEAWPPAMPSPPQVPGSVEGDVYQHHCSGQQGHGPVPAEERGPGDQRGKEEGVVPKEPLAGAEGQAIESLGEGRGKALLRQVASGQGAAEAEPIVPGSNSQGKQDRQGKENDWLDPGFQVDTVPTVEIVQQKQSQERGDNGVAQSGQQGNGQARTGQQGVQPESGPIWKIGSH